MAINEFFTWGAAGEKKTPAQVAREREIAETILMRAGNTSPVGHWTQGAARVVDALGGVLKERRAAAGEADIASRNKALVSPILAALTGGSTATAPSSIPMTSAAGEVAATAPSQPIDMTGNEVYNEFIGAAREGGLTNPFGLAALAATGKAESGFDPGNVNRTWSDPSQSGQPGTAGGILSWRGPRYQALAATGDLSPRGQGNFFIQENPQLIAALNNAQSVEEAQSAINNAWRFAGYDQPGGETARRLQLARSFLPTFQGGGEVAATTPEAAIEAFAPLQPAMAEQAPVSLSDEVAAYQQTPEYAAAFPGRQSAPPLDAPVSVPTQPVAGVPMQSAPIQVAGGGDRVPMAAPSINPAIIEALTDPQATPQTQMLARIVLEQQQRQAQAAEEQRLQAADPLRQMQIERGQLELNALRNPTPGFRPLSAEEKTSLGLNPQGAFQVSREGHISQIGGGGVNITNEGTIPAGYQAVRDAQGRVTAVQPLPGSPAALEMEQALKARDTQGGRKQTSTDVITNAASNARELIKSGTLTTGTLGRIASNLTESDAAELRRQVDVLKSNATIENLTAMRQASPTGGALGSVTEKEGAMLAAAAGAIDPNAGNEQVAKQLDNYEKTLLRVIHGPKVGDAIFEQTRQQKPISEMTDEELEALANGD